MENPPQIMPWTYLVPLRLPYTTLTNKPRFARLLRGCVAEADHLCTVSEFSRRDIIDQCGIAPQRISNTYQASFLLAESFDKSAKQVKGIFGLDPRSFFLFCPATGGSLFSGCLSCAARSYVCRGVG
jgi:hypothetical protein